MANNTSLRYVAGVSWPRSGHHLLVRLMSGYFGESFNYCEFYSENIDCCRKFPCERSRQVTFSKNHDFKREISTEEKTPYLVQYRDFFNSVTSEFELLVKRHGERCDNKAEFTKFSVNRSKHYKEFIEKWVNKAQTDTVLRVPYDSLVMNTVETAKSCILHFSPGAQIDIEKLKTVVKTVDGEKVENQKIVALPNAGVHASRDHKTFRFYDKEWQERIDSILAS